MDPPVRNLVCDQDFKCSKRFDHVLKEADITVEPTVPFALRPKRVR